MSMRSDLAVLYDWATVDHAEGRLHRLAHDNRRDWVVRAREANRVQINAKDVATFAGLDRADVRATEHGGAAQRGQLQRRPSRHQRRLLGRRPQGSSQPRQQECLTRLGQHVRSVVAGGSVDAQADRHALPRGSAADRRDARRKPHVGRRAMGHARRRSRQQADLALRSHGLRARTRHRRRTSPATPCNRPAEHRMPTGRTALRRSSPRGGYADGRRTTGPALPIRASSPP